MSASLKEKSVEASERIDEIKLKYEKLCVEVKDNGDDPEELKILERLELKIAKIIKQISVASEEDCGSGSGEEDDAGEADWDSIEPKLEELREIVDRLTLAGHGAATSLFNQYSETLEARTEERWEDAVSLLKDALELAHKVIASLDDDDGGDGTDPAEAEWKSLSGLLDELKSIIAKLASAEDKMCGSFQSRCDEVIEAADDTRWQDAIDLLQNAIELARKYIEQVGEGGSDCDAIAWVIEAVVKDTDGKVIPDIEVSFDGPASTTMPTDSKGVARFDVTGAGCYTVQASRPGGQSQVETIDQTTPEEGAVLVADLVIEAVVPSEEGPVEGGVAWSIKAIVTDEDGKVSSGTEVRLVGPAGQSMDTDSKGEALFEITGPGRYMVQAYKDDSESSAEVFNQTEPVEGEVLEAELELQGAPSGEFLEPTESNEPTIRKGDEDPDGWIEYMQKLLNAHLNSAGEPNIPISGKFDGKTDGAVRWFQGVTECKVDGIVGNQTWSALREDKVRDEIGTDGREAGSHSEEGAEARWSMESNKSAVYEEGLDSMRFAIASTGTEPIDDFNADIFIDGTRDQMKIGEPNSSVGGQSIHFVWVTRFRERFGDGPFEIKAYLPQELGGDLWSNTVEIPAGTGPTPQPERPNPETDVSWVIQVTVKDQNGNPVAKAGVEFDGPVALSGVTDAAGRVSHEVKGPGCYQIKALLDDIESDVQKVDESAPKAGLLREVQLVLELTDDCEPVPVEQTKWIIDAVVCDQNGNRLKDAAVYFDGPIAFTGMTDATGSVSHEVEGAGEYELKALYGKDISGTELVKETEPKAGTVRKVELTVEVATEVITDPEDCANWYIDVILKNQHGDPIPKAAVDFDGPIGLTGITDALGRCTHMVRGSSSYKIQAFLEDAKSKAQTIKESEPKEGMIHEVELVIETEEVEEEDDFSIMANVSIEISVEMWGSVTAVWDEKGKFAGIDLKKPIVEKSLKGGADGLIGGGAVGIAATLEGRMKGNKLTLTSKFVASGSVMVGLGVAAKAWLGAGVKFDLKFSRVIETVTYDFDKSVLENAAEIIKKGGKFPPLEAAFGMPAKFVLAGQFDVVVGGGGVLEVVGSKMIKKYDPMIVVEISATPTSFSIEAKACPGVFEFINDMAHITNPNTMRVVDELLEIAEDPEHYVENKRDQVEDVVERISGLPSEIEEHFGDEIKGLMNRFL